ncbi:MAG: radical SAM protein, partial [Oscillospiraceae bacterium]
EKTAEELVSQVLRYREYFGESGGITLSGGEPLMQPEFSTEIFKLCKEKGIHTCLDTSGCLLNEKIESLLSVTDMVLLDLKYTREEDYRRYVGCSLQSVLDFLTVLAERNIPTWLRQVVIPGKNDREENHQLLQSIARRHKNVEKVELLPFRKLCREKYRKLKIPFPFENLPEADPEQVEQAQRKWFSL